MCGYAVPGCKRGFNLIEIAIVLAVIGLVIGGIYVAASAVTENNRVQNLQKQVLVIVSNVRTAYAGQSNLTMPTYAQAVAMQIFPGDMPPNGTNGFVNSYGGRTMIYNAALYGDMELDIYGISQSGCTKFLTSLYGNPDNNTRLGANLIVNMSNGQGGTADVGITPATATTICGGATNNLLLTFHIR